MRYFICLLATLVAGGRKGKRFGDGEKELFHDFCVTVYMPADAISEAIAFGHYEDVDAFVQNIGSIMELYSDLGMDWIHGSPDCTADTDGQEFDVMSLITEEDELVFPEEDPFGKFVCYDICGAIAGPEQTWGSEAHDADYIWWLIATAVHQTFTFDLFEMNKQNIHVFASSSTWEWEDDDWFSGSGSGDDDHSGDDDDDDEDTTTMPVTSTGSSISTTTDPFETTEEPFETTFEPSTTFIPDTTTLPETTKIVTTTTSTTTQEVTTTTLPEMIRIEMCLDLFFPVLWILQTQFGGLFDFCPVFKKNLCDQIEWAGGACWLDSCEAECQGDVDLWDKNDNINDAAVQQKDKFGCFEVCLVVDFSPESFENFQQIAAEEERRLSTTRFDFSSLEDLLTDLAQEALVETVLDGPADSTGENEGGYKCLDGTQTVTDTETLDCLQTDTEDNGFVTVCADPDNCTEEEISEVAKVDLESSTTTSDISGIDCEVANGGCTHTCTGEGLDGQCACPNECWVLDADGLTCSVKADMVELICHPDKMEVHLAKCVVAGMSDYTLGNSVCSDKTDTNGDPVAAKDAAIVDGACVGTQVVGVDADLDGDGNQDDGCLAFAIKLDECSTQVNANYMNDSITFTQQLVSEANDFIQQTNNLGNTGSNAIISHAPRVNIDFSCQYTSDYVTQESEVETVADDVTHHLISHGRFAYALETVTPTSSNFNSLTNDWETKHSQDDRENAAYMVGSTLYFRICSQHELSNVYFSVPDCTVKNWDETESYQIITNHCLDPFVNTERVGRWTDHRFQTWEDGVSFLEMPTNSTLESTNLATDQCLLFSYTVFEFISSADNDEDLKLTCNVKACEYSDMHPNAMEPCTENTCGGRKRRSSVLDQEQYVTVSQTIKVLRN